MAKQPFRIRGFAIILGATAVISTAVALTMPRWKQDGAHNSLNVVISGDTAGWIVPCGCTSNQSGGLPRRGTFVRELKTSSDVIVVDAGGAPAGTTPYHRVKFEAILAGEIAMGLAAHNLGGPELALGADYLRDVAKRMSVPFISANVSDMAGTALAASMRIVEIDRRRVALAGVVSPRFARPDVKISDPREELLTALAKARGTFDSLIVLAYMPEDELRAFAAQLPEADAVVGGPTGQSIAPLNIGATLVAAATNKGKFIVQIGPAEQSRWSGRVVELDGNFADDADQEANVKKYLNVLGERNFTATETGFAPQMPSDLPADYRLAGSASCANCHGADCSLLETSKHAHAWNTLEARGYHVDGFCQQCHTTSYGLPGGFASVNSSPNARNVGCESCHGPAQSHVRDPKVRTPFAARDQCVRCHDRENSPSFAYDQFWEKIRHGTKVAPRGGVAP